MSEIFQDPDYLHHLAQSVRRETHGKTVHRRHFLQLLSTLGIGTGTLGFVASASAQQKELVVANWGGDALAVHRDVLAAEFAKRYPGSRVAFDTTGPTPGKIKAMVESGNIAWDVADRNLLSALDLGRQGLLEKVDESIVDINAVPSQFRTEWGIGSYLFSYVIAYDTARFGAAPPRTWKDFWDTQNFQGKRALRNNVEGILESALLADGVARDKLYPLDVARGLEKVRAIKKDTIFYNNASDAQQLLRSGEVSAGSLWSTRAQGVKEDTKGRVDYHFNEGILLRLARIDVVPLDPVLAGRPQDRPAGELGPIVADDASRFAIEAHQRVEFARDPDARDAGVPHQAQVLAAGVIVDRQDAQPAGSAERIGHEVHRPAVVRPQRHGHRGTAAASPQARRCEIW